MPCHPRDTAPRPDANSYKDIRSHGRDKSRLSKRSAKYYGFRGVHPSWIDKPYLRISPPLDSMSILSHPKIFASCAPLVIPVEHDIRVATWTKRDMWLDRENDIWPLDCRHHTGKRVREKRYSSKYTELALGRRMKQISAQYEWAVEDARDIIWDEDYESVYRELQEREWDEVEVSDEKNGAAHLAWIGLDGERCFDAWFEDDDHVVWAEYNTEVLDDRPVELVDDGFCMISEADWEAPLMVSPLDDDGFVEIRSG